MIHQIIKIQAPGYKEEASLYTYFLDNSVEMQPERTRPVILICPGGGYSRTSNREAEPIAIRFLAMGYHAAILRYSCAPTEQPAALLQLAQSILFLKEHAKEYHIDPDKIILQGSSAGGHLAASMGVFWNQDFVRNAFALESSELLKPAGLILSYPVITSGEYAHHGSFQNLLGNRYEELKETFSLEKQVTDQTPPTFLWHTITDATVPVENSILFFMALKNAGVPAELHVYPIGSHGLGLANEETQKQDGFGLQKECQSWIDLAHTWCKSLFHKL